MVIVFSEYKVVSRSGGISAVNLFKFWEMIDYFKRYGIILLVVSPTVKWTAKSVSNSNGVTTQWLCGNA